MSKKIVSKEAVIKVGDKVHSPSGFAKVLSIKGNKVVVRSNSPAGDFEYNINQVSKEKMKKLDKLHESICKENAIEINPDPELIVSYKDQEAQLYYGKNWDQLTDTEQQMISDNPSFKVKELHEKYCKEALKVSMKQRKDKTFEAEVKGKGSKYYSKHGETADDFRKRVNKLVLDDFKQKADWIKFTKESVHKEAQLYYGNKWDVLTGTEQQMISDNPSFKRSEMYERLCKEGFNVGDRVKVPKTGNVTLDSLGSGKVIKQVQGTVSNPEWYQVKFDNGITKDVSSKNLKKE